MKIQQKTIEKLRQLINEETEYRSGPNLITFFSDFGFLDSYGQGFPSRWMYTEEKLNILNGTDKIAQCIKKLFSPINFIGKTDILDGLIADFNQYLMFDGYKVSRNNTEIVISKIGADEVRIEPVATEDEFISREFKNISLDKLGLDSPITGVLSQRLDEIKKCLGASASLATIFLCGSALEGILLGTATARASQFTGAAEAPRGKDGKVLPLPDWKLHSFIDAACSVGLLGEDVKKFSHALRDFRNYIHPHQQMMSQFNPDEHTARICWQVLQAAISQLSK